jgi:hypothetical protein
MPKELHRSGSLDVLGDAEKLSKRSGKRGSKTKTMVEGSGEGSGAEAAGAKPRRHRSEKRLSKVLSRRGSKALGKERKESGRTRRSATVNLGLAAEIESRPLSDSPASPRGNTSSDNVATSFRKMSFSEEEVVPSGDFVPVLGHPFDEILGFLTEPERGMCLRCFYRVVFS